MKITRKLSKELLKPKEYSELRPSTSMCQLKMRHNCCSGQGFQISCDGPVTRAHLCPCVAGCRTCSGQARIMAREGAIPCRTPHPQLVVGAINQAAIPSRYGGASLEQFSNFSGNGKEIAQRLLTWCQKYQARQARGFLLEGPVGVGKTYLLAAVALFLAKRGIRVRFVDFFQLLTTLKAGYSTNQADDSILRPLIDVEVLVVDELGKGRNSDWEQSILDQLVMGRYNQNKVILASTNYSVENPPTEHMPELTKFLDHKEHQFKENFSEYLGHRVGLRIYSRFVETCDPIKMTGEDYRRRFLKDYRKHLPPERPHH